jgi:hypothetical protein
MSEVPLAHRGVRLLMSEAPLILLLPGLSIGKEFWVYRDTSPIMRGVEGVVVSRLGVEGVGVSRLWQASCASPWDATEALCLEPYGGPMGEGVFI